MQNYGEAQEGSFLWIRIVKERKLLQTLNNQQQQ